MENMNHDTYFSGGETRVFLPIWHNALDLHNIPLGHSLENCIRLNILRKFVVLKLILIK